MQFRMKFGMLLVVGISFFLSYLFHVLSSNIDAIIWLDKLIDSYANESTFNQYHNTFLQGNYAPVDVEHQNLDLIPLSGHLPKDISGLFLRTGPNPIPHHIGSKKLHRFDGHGMIHSIRIRGQGESVVNGVGTNRITYSNQYIHTPRYVIEKQYNQSIFLNTGERKGIVGIFKMLMLLPLKLKYFGLTEETAGFANMNLVVLGSRIYACQEGSLPFALHWNENNTFDSMGYELTQTKPTATFTSSASVLSLPMTSHPKVDIRTQTMYFTGFSKTNSGASSPSAIYGSSYGTHSLQIIDYTDVILPTRPWIHDMIITEHYLLLFCGAIVTHSGAGAGIPSGTVLTFDPEVKFEIGVASKDDAEFLVGGAEGRRSGGVQINRDQDEHQAKRSLQWFRGLDSAAIMHVANAWEEVNAQNHTLLVLWAPICEKKNSFDGSFLTSPNVFTMARVVLNLHTGQMRKGTLGGEYNVDYPIVHPAYQGYRSKYIFASIMSGESDRKSDKEPIGIIKYNVFDKIIEQTIYFPKGVFSGEMVPLPKRKNNKSSANDNNGISNDSDGSDSLYLASFFYNSNTNASEWHIYDGESMETVPVATYSVPVRVPYGFHGEWIQEEVLHSIMHDF